MRILAIGGGELRERETLPLDEEMVRMTGKAHPRALLLPTASGDSPDYLPVFRSVYADVLGCAADALYLLSEPGGDVVESMIAEADLIYVGGGNTKMMLEVWRRLGVDVLLRRATEAGTVLGGVSAGAICWFQYGNSDAPLFEGRTDIRTCRIDGLGFVDAAACPHTTREEHRLAEFEAMMRDTPGVGLGLDDLCGLQIEDSKYRVLSAGAGAGLHKVRWVDGEFVHEFVAPHEDWRELGELIA